MNLLEHILAKIPSNKDAKTWLKETWKPSNPAAQRYISGKDRSIKTIAGTPGRYINEALKRGNYGQGMARAGILGAGYLTAAGAGRALLTDGGMFSDSQGDFDIAGIPFI